MNEKIGGMLMKMFLVMNGEDYGLHNCCSIGLLQILVTTRVAIPPHLLVVPHTEWLLENVSLCIFDKSILVNINIGENNIETLLTAEILLRGIMFPKGPISG